MKNNIFYLLLTSFIFLSCKQEFKNGINTSATNTSETTIQSKVKGCGYTSLVEIEKNFLPAEDRVSQIVENIVSYSGLPNNFKVYRADYINNAFETIIDNERVIVYDSKLFNDVEWYSDTFWTSVSIFAHEIGHHLSGHTEDNLGSVPLKELEADKFSGYVLYKMGATKEQALKAMKLIGSENDSQTHPSKIKRLQAIEEGWDSSSEQRYKSAIPPAPSDDKKFSNGSYYKDEFFQNELIGIEELQAESYGKLLNNSDKQILEGIIIDIEQTDPSGGERARYFGKIPSSNNKIITIQFTKVNLSSFAENSEENRKVGDREKFHLLEYPGELSRAELSWLEVLLVPGRKIRFKCFYFGYGASDIIYIKKLDR